MLDIEKCTACAACASSCPQNAISLIPNNEGFLYPDIDIAKCNKCNICKTVCLVFEPLIKNSPIKAYCAYTNNIDIRMSSSSGGIFYYLAKSVIDKKGCVFGAVFDNNFNVVHSHSDELSGISSMQGSKYVQSSTGDCYIIVKELLQQGRFVLYTGTPCQTAGLKKFIKDDYDNLLCQDILCHGVPSPRVWQDYIRIRSEYAKSTPHYINFREKPWKSFSLKINFLNGSNYKCVFGNNPYMQLFLQNKTLRNSCYNCPAKGKSGADITLGDYWGVNRIHPDMDDDCGTSLVIINTDKGLRAVESIKDNLKITDSNAPTGGMYWNSVMCPEHRKSFFIEYNNAISLRDTEKVFVKYAKLPFSKRLIRCIKQMIPMPVRKLLYKLT